MNENMIAMVERNQKAVSDLETKMAQLQRLLDAGQNDAAENMMQELLALSQQVVVQRREMVLSSDNPALQSGMKKIIAQMNSIEIGFTEEGWFGVRMMPLARTKETACKEYIRGILAPELKRFFADKANVRYPECVLIFRHVYDRANPESGRRDYNNAEVKIIRDLVAMYVMVDDNPFVCETYYLSAPGDVPRTDIFVVPQSEFLKWLQVADAIPEEGLRLTDQIPQQWKADK